jgi:alkylhydroperoxidase/carboxymuconolactone decarboxylase family protein YurZ
MGLALENGASAQEIIEVLELATAQGLNGCNLGVEILVEELAIAGHDTALPHGELSAEQNRLRTDYQARFGDWPDFCDHLLRLDPGYFAVMFDLLSVAPPANGLDPKSRGLIALALSACFTSLNPHGLRLQIRRALKSGTDQREILQVLQMTAHLGVHACTVGVPLLLEAIGEAPDGGDGKAP